MDLPIRFPDDADAIAEEAARFRALSPEARLDSIRGVIAAGSLLIRNSSKAVFIRDYIAEQERQSQRAVREFISRYAGSGGGSSSGPLSALGKTSQDAM